MINLLAAEYFQKAEKLWATRLRPAQQNATDLGDQVRTPRWITLTKRPRGKDKLRFVNMTYNSLMDSLPEPWMRGPIAGVDPLLAPVLYTFQQAREDLRHWTEGLSASQLWAMPHGLGSVGFHMRHIAGSTERLMSYLQGKPLNAVQLATLQAEHDPAGAGRDELLALVDAAFEDAERIVRTLDPATLREPRGVGRRQLPTTVLGLLVHIAEHTQRHVGQAITTAKLAAL
jgi:uncharacterized damage-inducible protein DinB